MHQTWFGAARNGTIAAAGSDLNIQVAGASGVTVLPTVSAASLKVSGAHANQVWQLAQHPAARPQARPESPPGSTTVRKFRA